MSYRPKYHFTANKGWINDPNGFVYFNNQYHLFFQHHAEHDWPGLMSWGHAISDDLVKFTQVENAINPTQKYDKDGCWSGSSFVKDGKLYMMYTGQNNGYGTTKETQNLVTSKDGINFVKYEGNPSIPLSKLPRGCTHQDFRDPSMYFENGLYYVLCGNRSKKNKAQLLRFKSKDLVNWEFDKKIFSTDMGFMIECPSTTKIGDKRVLIMSPQGLKVNGDDYWNVNNCAYCIGGSNLERISPKKFHEIDHGLDFYAPHVIADGSILVAWMNNWQRSIPTREYNEPWANAFTMPRQLSIKGNRLIQMPVESFKKYFHNKKKYSGTINKETEIEGFKGIYSHIHITFDSDSDLSIKVLKKENKYAEIKYEDGILYSDRRNTVKPVISETDEKAKCNYRQVTLSKKKKVTLDIYLDRVCIETYANNGEDVMSMLAYNPEDFDGITFASKKGANVVMYIEQFKD